MTSLDNYSLDDRYANDQGRVFLTGIQALARAPMEQLRIDAARGLNTAVFISGYQGSPLGGFDQEMARARKRVPDLDIVCKPGVNEELAATAVMGSQVAPTLDGSRYDGVIGYWYGKAPGVDRASDALRHAVYAGSHPMGGAVALVGDDPACKSSTLPSSSDLTMMNLKMPVLYPGDVQDVLDLGRHAVALARFTGLWTGFKIVTAVADGSGTVDLSLDRVSPVIPDATIDGNQRSFKPSANLIAPFTNERERDINEAGLVLAQRYSRANNLNRVVNEPLSPWLGLVATGYTYRELLQALRRLGFDGLEALADAGVRVLRLDMPFPLAPEPIRQFARGLQTVMVVEEKGPSLEWMIKDVLYDMVDRPALATTDGDGRPLFPRHGFLTADQMVGGLRSVMETRLGDRLAPEPPKSRERVLIPLSTERSPYFCSGCPHNWGTKVPDDTLVGAGIGCSGMALLMDGDTVGAITGITCMGAEGAQWIGMEPFTDDDHYIQNLGDGTFFHSGQLAMQAAIAAGTHMTYKLLYNGTVAMTGGQDPEGQVGVPDIVRIALAHGVTDAIITTDDVGAYDGVDLPSGRDGKAVRVWDRTRIVEAQRYLATLPGVTLLVHDQACAAQTRRLRKRGVVSTPGFRVAVNHRLCEACGDCGEVSNCLSVHSIDTDLGPKTLIDQTTCNFDFSCMEGDCPSFMTVTVDESKGRSMSPKRRLGLGRSASDDGWDLPEPSTVHDTGDAFNVRLAGIGGTGVVTVAQILATAAMLDGWNVRGLDQTGLSQKAGPVVSDIRLDRRRASDSNLLGQGEADLVVGFDLVVAASDRTLAAAEQGRTVFVASASPTPTGEMIGRSDVLYPAQDDLEERVAGFSRPELNRYVDAGALTRSLLGDGATANVFLLGVAVQAGLLPVDRASIERAIDLNGVAVDANLAAFEWGRRWAHDRSRVEAIAGRGQDTTVDLGRVAVPALPSSLAAQLNGLDVADELADRIGFLAADLVGYQDEAYARAFLEFVASMAAAERRVRHSAGEFTLAAAEGLHKLMAYKDEYEVARLLIAPESKVIAESVGGPGAKVTWKLHPPLLRALGMDSKISIDQRVGRPMMAVLARGKRLRGTALDPFGHTRLRRLERALVGEYRTTLERLAAGLSAESIDRATMVARAAMDVRGYEDLKAQRADVLRSVLRHATGEEK